LFYVSVVGRLQLGFFEAFYPLKQLLLPQQHRAEGARLSWVPN